MADQIDDLRSDLKLITQSNVQLRKQLMQLQGDKRRESQI
jgi:hypothetical protein